jgi:DNA (cytosine-5)-methyltransferase 1
MVSCKSYKCNNCDRKFIRESNLKKHKCISNKNINKKDLEDDIDTDEDDISMDIDTLPERDLCDNNLNNLNDYVPLNKSFTFIDLFCGIGGFHIALKQLGGRCVLACDINKECRKIYEKNHNLKVMDDVYNLTLENVPNHDVLCGGFPCQAFSNAGHKKAFDDKRGLLFDEIIRIMREKKPKICILENVKHILKVSNGEVYRYILKEINNCGYTCIDTVLSPHQIGIKQNRQRVIFMVIRNDLCKINTKEQILNTIEKLKNIYYLRNCNDNIFEEYKNVDSKYYISDELSQVFDAWNEFLLHFKNYNFGVPVIIEYFKESQCKSNKNWKNIYIKKNNELYNNNKQFIDKWYNKHKLLLNKKAIYKKLEWQVGIVKNNDKIDNYFIQMRQSGIRVKKIDYFPTLVAVVQVPIYGKERRYLTPKECARLQSIPDNFIWDQSDNYTYKQLGNGVNTSVIKLCTESVLMNISF